MKCQNNITEVANWFSYTHCEVFQVLLALYAKMPLSEQAFKSNLRRNSRTDIVKSWIVEFKYVEI
jgi:predicted Fe-S protein YdhL (DUF1289 family)